MQRFKENRLVDIIFVSNKQKSCGEKYKADNGLGNIFWGIMTLILLGILIYKFTHRESIWLVSLYFAFSIVFILSVTIKEYAITHQNFLEIRFFIETVLKKRRIAIGDIVGMKKLKKTFYVSTRFVVLRC